jgi:HPt (histidine-containing phosphotransfer) domain-containing protein
MNPLLSQFLSESREFSENIGDKLMQLERTPEDQNTVNELFRLVHTLKGNSGLFTFPEMTRVLHAGEDLLGLVRNGQLAYSRELADRLLDGIDLVMVMCGDIESTEKIDASRAQDSARMVEALRVLLPSAPDLPVSDGADVSGSSSTVAALSQMKLPLLEEIPEATRLDAFHRRGIGEQVYWIAYTPARECFFQGDDPFYLARQVPGILWGTTQPSGPLPALAELDIRLFFGVARTSGWTRCTGGWGRSDDRRNTCDVLGRIGHGDDRRHRLAIWSSCMSRTDRKLPTGNGDPFGSDSSGGRCCAPCRNERFLSPRTKRQFLIRQGEAPIHGSGCCQSATFAELRSYGSLGSSPQLALLSSQEKRVLMLPVANAMQESLAP